MRRTMLVGLLLAVGGLAAAQQNGQSHELIRNGGFDLGGGGWAVNGSMVAGPSAQASRQQGGVGMQLSTDQTRQASALLQDLYLPAGMTRARLTLDYRVGTVGGQRGALRGFSVLLSANRGQGSQPVAVLTKMTQANYPGPRWLRLDVTLDAAALARLKAERTRGSMVVLMVVLAGVNVSAHLDNISFETDGRRAPDGLTGRIAYVTGDAKVSRIVSVKPDGTDPRTLFTGAGSIYGMAWSPDGKSLVFSSSHEMAWSRWSGDLYLLNGGKLRRLTNPPSYAAFKASGKPTGRVTGVVRNMSRRQRLIGVYVEGGARLATMTLAPAGMGGDRVKFSIDGVVDLGAGRLQYVVAREGGKTWLAANQVDVKAGESVKLVGEVRIYGGGTGYHASSPTWHRDGKKVFFSVGPILQVPVSGGPGGFAFGNLSGWGLSASPVDERVLFEGLLKQAIWVVQPGQKPSIVLKYPGATIAPSSPVWLPDGSGFLYTMGSTNRDVSVRGTDIYLYGFQAKRSVRMTQLLNEVASRPRPSPDGRYIVFERFRTNSLMGTDARNTRELWVMQANSPMRMWPLATQGNPSLPAWGR